jgi:hypothetical protein
MLLLHTHSRSCLDVSAYYIQATTIVSKIIAILQKSETHLIAEYVYFLTSLICKSAASTFPLGELLRCWHIYYVR